MSLLQYFNEVWVWSQCREQQYLHDMLSLALEPVLSWMPGVAFYKDAPANEKYKDGFKAGSFQYVLALWHCAIWRGARWMVAPCPLFSALPAAGGANSGVHCSNTLGACTWISSVLGECGCLQKHNSQSAFQDSFHKCCCETLGWDWVLGLSHPASAFG